LEIRLEFVIRRVLIRTKKHSKLLILNGAGDRARTGDVQLGKLKTALFSYFTFPYSKLRNTAQNQCYKGIEDLP